MKTTHIEAFRTATPDRSVYTYCGRIAEKRMDIMAEGLERVTYLPYTRHYVTPTGNDSRKLCKSCLRALPHQKRKDDIFLYNLC